MARILVAGLINIETTLRIESFPLAYNPVNYPFFGVGSTVSGVGYNIAKALTVLGHQISLLSMIGTDSAAGMVRTAMAEDRLVDANVVASLAQTPQSVIVYDSDGRRQIHVDLKDIQQRTYPKALFDAALSRCEGAALCNINFARPMLARAKAAGKWIATDVHAISSLDDDYNRDFMAAADILFMSDELLPASPEDWAGAVAARYSPAILVIGLGSQGALLHVAKDRFIGRVPVPHEEVVNTVGAGDALFSAFLHAYTASRDPYRSVRTACLFAAHKIGTRSAAEGFLTAEQLDRLG